MWFSNLRLYRLVSPLNKTAEQFEEALNTQAFTPCASQEMTTTGWVEPLGKHGSQKLHVCGSAWVVSMKRQERVLPASVVNELVAEKVDEIETAEARKVYKKEKTQIKEELIFELTPKAFCKSRVVRAYLDTTKNWLIVDASSATVAEELINLLRDSLGSFAVVPWSTRQTPSDTLTHWLSHGVEGEFELGSEVELVSRAIDGGAARLKDQLLIGDEVQTLLANNKRVKKLALVWREHISCIVDEELAIKRVKFTEGFEEGLDNPETDTIADQLDYELSVMVEIYRPFLEAMIEAFGGFES